MARATGDEVDDRVRRARRPLIVVHLMKTGGFSLLYQVMRNVQTSSAWGVPEEGADELERMSHYSSVEQLRTLDEDARSRLEVVVGHLPFAVVDVAGFDEAITATIVREPVARVLSYLSMCKQHYVEHRDLPLEQIYEDTFFGPRTIHNHQTKMLGMTAEQATTRPPAPEETPHPDIVELLVAEGYFDSPQFLADVNNGQFFTALIDTPLVWPVPVDRSTLDNARRNLERVDVLGVHEGFDSFLTRLGDRVGWAIDLEIRANRGAEVDVPASFRRRIEEDEALDLELYEHARTLAPRA